MQVIDTALLPVKVMKPRRFHDNRGHFAEVYNERVFREAIGCEKHFVQDNYSYSKDVGTVRGLHFQSAPYEQDKLAMVMRGRIFDVAVDLRRGSPTYGRHAAVELSAEEGDQIWIPAGFAHGFMTLTPDVVVMYKVTNFYSKDHDLGLRWDDPQLGIKWPHPSTGAILSEKDARQPILADLLEHFA